MEVYDYLQTESRIQQSPIYPSIRNMYLSDREREAFCHSLHNLSDIQGVEVAFQKLLDIYRVNPLLAVEAMKHSAFDKYAGETVLAMKLLFSAVSRRNDVNNGGIPVVLNSMVPYTILLIEAAYQDWVCDLWDTKEVFLSYAYQRDYEEHRNGRRNRFLSQSNIRHILHHISPNRKIEFINWFWDKHTYVVTTGKKAQTYAGKCVGIIMSELTGSCLWKHLESEESEELSEDEQRANARERNEITRFIQNTLKEGRHLQYAKIVLGEDNFQDKLKALLGEDAVSIYEEKWEKQLQAEEEERLSQLAYNRRKAYRTLVADVKEKYQTGQHNSSLEWPAVGSKNAQDQLSLWNYWQGFNFEDVKLMVLGYDWGSVNDKNAEMTQCLRKIAAIKKGDIKAKYYSCEYKKTDYSLEWFFKQCFQRDIRSEHFTDLFFSTLCLGYRKRYNVIIEEEAVLSDVKDFLPREISIIAPKVIFCLGPEVYRLFCKGLGMETVEAPANIEDVVRNTYKYEDKEVLVYMLPHCGVAGLKEMPLQKQLEIWEKVYADMKDCGIVL